MTLGMPIKILIQIQIQIVIRDTRYACKNRNTIKFLIQIQIWIVICDTRYACKQSWLDYTALLHPEVNFWIPIKNDFMYQKRFYVKKKWFYIPNMILCPKNYLMSQKWLHQITFSVPDQAGRWRHLVGHHPRTNLSFGTSLLVIVIISK